MVPNRTTQVEPGFYVSYNSVDAAVYGEVTTAVVVGAQMDRFYVLNGNHEAALAGKPFDFCLEYVHDHAERLNKYSDILPPRGSTIAGILAVPRVPLTAVKA
jgi:hypothetical protein